MYLDLIVVTLTCFLVWYVSKQPFAMDSWILIISLIVLLVTYILKKQKKFDFIESFVSNVSIPEPINMDEDFTIIKNDLVSYISIFKKGCIDEKDQSMNDLVHKENRKYKFSSPISINKEGIDIGNNSIKGPLCSDIGISLKDSFSIAFACRIDNPKKTSSRINVLNLYANSKNNNAISLWIDGKTIKNVNNISIGTLKFQYANLKEIDLIPSLILNKNDINMFFIIKNSDNIRILTINDNDGMLREMANIKVSVSASETFSNRELDINDNKLFSGRFLSLAIFNTAINDDKVTTCFSHMMRYYSRNISLDYEPLINKFNDTLKKMQNMTKCPYDEQTCSKCSGVKNWLNFNDIVTSSDDCKSAIDRYCHMNTTSDICKCWTSSDPACVKVNAIFKKSSIPIIDKFNDSEIAYVKNKYSLENKETITANNQELGECKKKYDMINEELQTIKNTIDKNISDKNDASKQPSFLAALFGRSSTLKQEVKQEVLDPSDY